MPRTLARRSALPLVCLAFACLFGAALADIQRQQKPSDPEEPNRIDPRYVGYRTEADPLASDPSVAGQWTAPMNWPANAVHSILLRTGKVLWYRGDETTPTTYVWDPIANTLQSQTVGGIIWCGGNTMLDDGRVL